MNVCKVALGHINIDIELLWHFVSIAFNKNLELRWVLCLYSLIYIAFKSLV